MEERERLAEWKVKDAETKSKLTILERARKNVVAALNKVEEKRNKFGRQLSQQGASSPL